MTEEIIDYKAPITSDDSKLLRSRIDQQSELICILKKRADEFLLKYTSKDEECTRLTAENEKLSSSLAGERKRANSLENCYLNLGKVHHGLEAAMKEVDVKCAELQRECDMLSKENVQFLTKSEAKDSLIKYLEDTISNKDGEIKELNEQERLKNIQLSATLESNESTILTLKTKYHTEIDQLNLDMAKVNKSYVEITEELEAVRRHEKELENQLNTVMNMYTAEKKRCMELEERLQRRPERNNASEREALQRRISDLEDQHSRDLQNFNAYKGHAQDLLLQERSLNNQLRRLKSPDRMRRSDSVLTMKDSYSSGEGIA